MSRTVAVLPAAIVYDFEPYAALPRASRSVPRQTAPASPSQTTRTLTRPLRSTRRLRLDLIFALARLDSACAPATAALRLILRRRCGGSPSWPGPTVPPTVTVPVFEPPPGGGAPSTPRWVSVRFMNSLRAVSLMPSKPNPV